MINIIYVNLMLITKPVHAPKCRQLVSDVTKKRRLKEMKVQPRVRRTEIGPITFPNAGVCYTYGGPALIYTCTGNDIKNINGLTRQLGLK